MSATLKIIIAAVTVAILGAGGVALYQSQRVEVQVQAPPPPPPAAEPRMNIGDIDKLPPVKLPDTRTPAQKAASETKR
jgi:hypothetical protein